MYMRMCVCMCVHVCVQCMCVHVCVQVYVVVHVHENVLLNRNSKVTDSNGKTPQTFSETC